MLHERSYVSCNSNQSPTAVHWGKNNLICYAACNAVMIYSPDVETGGKVIATLVSHTKRVNSVRWLGERELVSGSSDNNAIVWSLRDGKYNPVLLTGHSSNINIVDGLYKGSNEDNLVVVTVSADCTVRIWVREHSTESFLLNQTINYGSSLCVGLRLSFLPHSNKLLLACATDTYNIDLHAEESDHFNFVTTLKGHEDWVRGLDFITDRNGDVLLASSSQDLYIRLWRISNETNFKEEYGFEVDAIKYSVNVDSILTGHEAWIYSVNWSLQSMQLLSASLDKSMIIWELDEESKLWMEKIRVGEVGGNTLGFYGGMFSPDGKSILAHSYSGAFHIWRNNKDQWTPSVTIGGHYAPVTDLAWDPQGQFIMSVSSDQTTRIHAPWSKSSKSITWHEIARPQVHGYAISALAIISRYQFASSAEEKIIRTFQAPQNFVENFKRLCDVDDNYESVGPQGASVPSLGLSNKAVFEINNERSAPNNKDMYLEESHFTAVILTEPPTEETLVQNTLWPEIQKLYGHGYEVYTLASSPDGLLLASACKATTTEHAAILLWDTTTGKQLQSLISHSLTVVQIAFSPNSQHLLSVSRDRRWSLFSKNCENNFELVATTDKKTSIHTRIIWCCGWSHDSQYFATGSRDGKVCVWFKNESKEKSGILGQYESASSHLQLKSESITALAFAPDLISSCYLIAIGLESGIIQLYKWLPQAWDLVFEINQSVSHHLSVRRLVFRPVFGKAGYGSEDKNTLQLASCGDDHSLIVHDVKFE